MAATRIGVIANVDKPNAREVLQHLVAALSRAELKILLERESARLLSKDEPNSGTLEELSSQIDLLVVLGGDGTILNSANTVLAASVPILGVNIGRLGFLTCATHHAVDHIGEWIRRDHYRLSSRSTIQASVFVEDERQGTYYGLNEITISRGAISRIIQLETRIDGEFVNSYNADGLIIATPTGSTAYSLSAGGPIMDPESTVFVITPICPHALMNRSIVVQDQAEIEVIPVEPQDEVILTVDGQTRHVLEANTRVHITRSPYDVQLALLPDQTFYTTLRQKMSWHGSNL